MKFFVSVSSITLFTIANANIIDLYEKLQNSTKTSSSYRNFDNNIFNNAQVATIFGDYGCWCFFQSNNGYVGNGFGAPVDDMDELCKKLHDQYSCIQTEDSTCDPWNVFYNVPNFNAGFNGVSEADIQNECAAFNQHSNCARDACIVESSFFKIYFESNIQLNQFFEHNVFDPNSQCSLGNSFSSWTEIRGTKQCCGSYPNAQIYYDGSKACCDDLVVYNSNTKQCCGNGVVKSMNDSC